MRKLILEEWMSLDGYVADKKGNLDFFTNITADQNKYSDEDQLKFLETVDTILLGRKTYELFVDFWPTATTDQEIIADRLNEIPKIIVSNTLKEAKWGNWPAASIISNDAVNEIRKLKEQEGKNIVLWGSISLAQSLMNAKLIDEYHIQLCPTVIGGGRSLFTDQDHYTNFRLAELRKYDSGLIFLNYQLPS